MAVGEGGESSGSAGQLVGNGRMAQGGGEGGGAASDRLIRRALRGGEVGGDLNDQQDEAGEDTLKRPDAAGTCWSHQIFSELNMSSDCVS